MNNDLAKATENGMLGLVKALVENGADITAWNNCALKLAAWGGHTETVKYLESQLKEKVG